MRRRMTLHNFAVKIGFKRTDAKQFYRGIKHLEKVGAIKVKQGGFLGDSMHHPKIAIIYDWERVKLHFGLENEREKQPLLKKYVGLPDYEKVESYFRKEEKIKKQYSNMIISKVKPQEDKPKPITRREFEQIAKTIRGEYPTI